MQNHWVSDISKYDSYYLLPLSHKYSHFDFCTYFNMLKKCTYDFFFKFSFCVKIWIFNFSTVEDNFKNIMSKYAFYASKNVWKSQLWHKIWDSRVHICLFCKCVDHWSIIEHGHGMLIWPTCGSITSPR